MSELTQLAQQEKKQTYNFNKLQKRLRRNVGNAIADFGMIEDGDKVMVCLSGGKDSYTLLDILLNLRQSAPIKFDIVAVNLDQKQPGFPEHVLPEYLESIGVDYKIVQENTYGIVKEKIPEGKTTCSLCSRLRRGILYRTATELGATKIALGHHRDDMLATLFLNMFYGGKMKSMPPKLISDDGKQIVIRPLAYCKEKDIEKYAIVKEKIPEGKTTCSLCSRLRRGILYRTATELGATKIALGHHRDDMLATLFLNIFYGGKLKSMPPKLISDDGKQIVIRPLAYCKEKDIEKYAVAKEFPIIPCNLCGSQPNLQRQVVKEMLNTWDRQYPGRLETMFSAMQNITLSHLCDPKLFDFKGIKHGQALDGIEGDTAFDEERIEPMKFDDEDASDYSDNEMISFKEVN